MKTIKSVILSIFIVILSCTSGKTQVTASLGLGANAIVKAPVIDLQAGVILGGSWTTQAGFQAHIDNYNPALFQVKIGRRLSLPSGSGLHLSGGYCYSLASTDDKSKNRRLIIGSAEYYRPIGADDAELVFGISATKGNAIITLSIRGIF